MKITEIETNNEIKKGICDLKKEDCTATSSGDIISVFDAKRQIYICNSCLMKKLSEGSWFIKGTMGHFFNQ